MSGSKRLVVMEIRLITMKMNKASTTDTHKSND